MKIKHKGQRNQGLTFQAELKLFSLCGPTSWCQRVVCASSGDGLWHRLSGGQLPGRCTCGFRCSVGVSTCGLQRAALCCSLRFSADGCDVGGDTLSSHSQAENPAPQCAGTSTEEHPSPKVSSASLRTLCSLGLRLSFFWFCVFTSECCTKIANPRNQGEADTHINTGGFFYKLEFVSKYMRHSRRGTWTLTWVLA